MSKNPVVHFEMPYKDPARVSKFYNTVFGWDMHDAGEQMGHYVVAHTTQTDSNNMVTTPGVINGGFYNLSQSKYSEPSVVISVDDISQAIEAIKLNGGEILGEPMDIPTVGKWVSFKDTEGNRASILQPVKMS